MKNKKEKTNNEPTEEFDFWSAWSNILNDLQGSVPTVEKIDKKNNSIIVNGEKETQKLKRRNAALKAWETRRKNEKKYTVKQLKKENKKLREALKTIQEVCGMCDYKKAHYTHIAKGYCIDDIEDIAKKALETK